MILNFLDKGRIESTSARSGVEVTLVGFSADTLFRRTGSWRSDDFARLRFGDSFVKSRQISVGPFSFGELIKTEETEGGG